MMLCRPLSEPGGPRHRLNARAAAARSWNGLAASVGSRATGASIAVIDTK